MNTEVDEDLFHETAEWYVYLHSRPDGEVFYVGKGRRKRAYDFAPSRRTKYHRNVVNKHGRAKIGVKLIPCSSEIEAHMLEKVHISMWRLNGARLANLTDGGEGVSGRVVGEKQAKALELGRGKKAHAKLSCQTKANILAGLARGRVKAAGWKKTAAGQAHMKRLGATGEKALHREHEVICAQCQEPFITRSAKAACCSRRCGQRHRRARVLQ